MNEFDYSDYCPNKDCDTFDNESNKTVDIYINSEALRPQAKINKEIRRLRKAIAALSPDTTQVLVAREARLVPDTNIQAYLKNMGHLSGGGAAVFLLQRLVSADLNRSVRKDGQARREFIVNAIATFATHGGEVSGKLGSEFLDYLEALAQDAGIEPFDAPKALRVFLRGQD